MQEIFKSFDKIHFDSIIITKVDETNSIGNVIDVAEKFKKPISYFTNGQEVPNDIVLADPEKLVNLMFGTAGN
jgi:flagellar biosynthesis protein FlhF